MRNNEKNGLEEWKRRYGSRNSDGWGRTARCLRYGGTVRTESRFGRNGEWEGREGESEGDEVSGQNSSHRFPSLIDRLSSYLSQGTAALLLFLTQPTLFSWMGGQLVVVVLCDFPILKVRAFPVSKNKLTKRQLSLISSWIRSKFWRLWFSTKLFWSTFKFKIFPVTYFCQLCGYFLLQHLYSLIFLIFI